MYVSGLTGESDKRKVRAMVKLVNAHGGLTDHGYALHMAYDINAVGFDGTGYDPVDAALALAALVVELTGEEG